MSVFKQAIEKCREERNTADSRVDMMLEWIGEHHPKEVEHVRSALLDTRFSIRDVMAGLEALECPYIPGETTLRRWRRDHSRG